MTRHLAGHGMEIGLLKRLCDAPGVSGAEDEVRVIAAEALGPLVDELSVDPMGNLIGIRHGTGPKVMVAAHLDEIGFRVSHVDDKGFLRLMGVGGQWLETIENQRVVVNGRRRLPGVLFREGGWLRADALSSSDTGPRKMDDYYVDLGLPREKVVEWVEIGDPVTMDRHAVDMGDMVCAKALDDRAGVFAMIEALRKLGKHEAEIYAVGSVQEEVGCRGAKVAAYGLSPDVAIAIDVCPARDTPGFQEHEYIAALGKGVALTISDAGTIADQGLLGSLCQIAQDGGIVHQLLLAGAGSTDAREIHQVRAGIPSITLAIPARYTHSCTGLMHKGDLYTCAELVGGFLEDAHRFRFGRSLRWK